MALPIVAIAIILVGLVCVSIFDRSEKQKREKSLGKKIAVFAIAMPFCYMLLDATGTFLDIFYTESAVDSVLVNVTDENIEHTANCAYEFTFFIVAVILYIFIRIKKQKLFEISGETQSGGVIAKISAQKWKILAAIFEVIGQATYLFALSEGSGIAAVILGAGTVIISLILSRIFLKEKLNLFQYIFIILIVGGIIMLSLV